MPILCTTFNLNSDTFTATREGTDYIFYVGSFLGGPIYFKCQNNPSQFTFTVKGAVRYAHYTHDYTTPDEFSETAPYFDLEAWQGGILHSGQRFSVGSITDYEDFYQAGCYWEKVTSFSNQVPSSGPAKTNVNMMYECFISAGGAVAFVGKGATNCPMYWLQYSIGYNQYLMDGSGDTWGPHHEYHHHFQNGWGLDDDGETSNNAVTKISQRRTEDHEPDGDGWNTYTSASWALRDVVEKFHDYHLCMHAILLHCFGQDIFIKATNKQYGRSNNGWHRAFTELTELDMTYFFRNVYYNRTISDEEDNRFSENNYKSFVPVACLYQTGIGYLIKGKRNEIHTMRPFLIKYNEDKILNFSKNIIVPKDISYTIKSLSNPKYGSLTKQADNIYIYKPDPKQLSSGKITNCFGLSRKGNPSFQIDDVEVYLEFQQT